MVESNKQSDVNRILDCVGVSEKPDDTFSSFTFRNITRLASSNTFQTFRYPSLKLKGTCLLTERTRPAFLSQIPAPFSTASASGQTSRKAVVYPLPRVYNFFNKRWTNELPFLWPRSLLETAVCGGAQFSR